MFASVTDEAGRSMKTQLTLVGEEWHEADLHQLSTGCYRIRVDVAGPPFARPVHDVFWVVAAQ